MLKPRDYQEDAVQSFFDYYNAGNNGNPIIVAATGCHASGTRILMHNGATKLVEDVALGDLIMGDDATSRTVLELKHGAEMMYRVIPIKGDPFIVNESHVLSLQTVNGGVNKRTTGKEVVNISVKDYLLKNKNFKHLHKLYKRPIKLNKKDILISPYMAGLLLGDGTLNRSVGITTMDKVVADEFKTQAAAFGCNIRIATKPNNRASTYYAYWKKGALNPFVKELKKEGFWEQKCENKHVPFKYKTGNEQQRLEMLAGLMDSDGHMTHSGFDFISKSQQLSKDVVYLSRSLGLSANIKKCIKGCQNNFFATYYRVSIYGDCSIIPTKVERQKAPKRRQIKDNLKTGFKIEECGLGEFFGFTLNKNHLYLTADFFVHHNSGKSLILAELIKKIMIGFAGQRVIMATHVANLVLQNAQKIIAQYPNCNLGIYSAGLGKKQPWADVIYGGIQSMYKYPEKFGKRDLLFIDEAHLLSPKSDGMYMAFIEGLKKQNPYLKIVGLSATPWRQKGGSLINQENAIFTDIIYDISLGYLIKRGYLTGLVGKSSVIQADLSGVKKIGGEFNLAQLEKAFDKEELTDAALDEVEKLAFDRKYFLFFCSGLDHCEHVAANLKDRGWECYTITGSTTQKRREFLLNKFRKSRTRIALINNTVLTTGTDLPNADCLVFLRGTQSSALFVQICGRVARPIYADGYDLSTDAGRLAAIANGSKSSSLILDYGGNIQRFGAVDLIEAPRSKSGIKSDEPTSPPQKICPNCRESLHVTVRECACGHIFDAPDRINHETSATTLAIMSTEMASTKHEIINTIYKSHVAKSGTPCLRVQYYDKMGFLASDYIPFSQFGNIRKMADEWFYEVTDKEDHNKLPRNTEEALAVKHLYNSPSFIHLRRKGKYSEIIKREYEKTLLTNNI